MRDVARTGKRQVHARPTIPHIPSIPHIKIIVERAGNKQKKYRCTNSELINFPINRNAFNIMIWKVSDMLNANAKGVYVSLVVRMFPYTF